MKAVRLSEYDAGWPEDFRRLRERIWPAVAGLALRIEHVGSTAVPGLTAKPVIDLDVVIAGKEALPRVIEKLAGLGYEHRGDLGVADREAFRRPANEPLAHHLYVCTEASAALRNHVTLRDHLRGDADAAAAYGRLKTELARQYPRDMERYVAGKSAFILAILARYGFSADELAAIGAAN